MAAKALAEVKAFSFKSRALMIDVAMNSRSFNFPFIQKKTGAMRISMMNRIDMVQRELTINLDHWQASLRWGPAH